jgi:hypothetical protein
VPELGYLQRGWALDVMIEIPSCQNVQVIGQ